MIPELEKELEEFIKNNWKSIEEMLDYGALTKDFLQRFLNFIDENFIHRSEMEKMIDELLRFSRTNSDDHTVTITINLLEDIRNRFLSTLKILSTLKKRI